MTRTMYQHHVDVSARAGTYYFDCVGMVNYFLRLGAPRALADLRASERIRSGYVPSPDKMGDYLRHLSSANPSWRAVRRVTEISPGDVIIMDRVTNPDTRAFVGHALIAASPPLELADGSYALQVFDSTGTPHGPDDSRLWDRRAIRDKPSKDNGSGLGMGTIQIWPDAQGAPDQIAWAIGKPPVPTSVEIGRPLS